MTAPRSPRGQRRPAAPAPVDQTMPELAGEPPRGDAPVREAAHGRGDGAEIQGVELAAVRTGDDTRRRGWFWHWNSIVTQYVPLIGLKGVGLLNSYTVWTDRRESSPMRGYAFPSQQSEADFYGEDRAELIAINKILVALDLIEIKKEMVLRVDEHGHRWRVPHNLYRVKDTDDSRGLTTADVLRVTELAERDAAVYRYLRRVFSARFSPIDPANVWHAILPEVRRDAAWQRLAAKTAREEERFSARSRAGHANRRAATGADVEHGPSAGEGITPITGAQTAAADDDIAATGTDASRLLRTGDTPAAETTANDTTGGGPRRLGATNVAAGNDGLPPDVGPSNRGRGPTTTIVGPTAVGPTNRGRPTGVAPSNTIEDQSTTTTTTTFGTAGNDDEELSLAGTTTPPDNVVRINRPVTSTSEVVTTPLTSRAPDMAQAGSGSDGGSENQPAAAASGDADAPARGLASPAAEVVEPLAGTRSRRPDRHVAEQRREDESLALTAFEAANGGRLATPAEVQILRQLAAQLDPAAAGDPELATGWAWLGAAIYEAVDAGSAYVAPRRIREIATRWQREGRPGADPRPTDGRARREDIAAGVSARPRQAGHPAGLPPDSELPSAVLSVLTDDHIDGQDDDRELGRGEGRPIDRRRRGDRAGRPVGTGPSTGRSGADAAGGDAGVATGDPTEPTHDGPALWDALLRELARGIESARLAELAGAGVVARVTMDEVELTAPTRIAAALEGRERPLLTRALSAVLRRTVRLTIRPIADAAPQPAAVGDTAPSPDVVAAAGVAADDPADARGPAPERRRDLSPEVVGEGVGARPERRRRALPPTTLPDSSRDHPPTTPTPESINTVPNRPDSSSPAPTAAADRHGGLGLSDAHLWAAVVDEVVRAGAVTAADVTAWLKSARIAGRTAAGGYVVAAPSDIARRRLDGPLRPALETALARVLGPGATLDVTTARSMLA